MRRKQTMKTRNIFLTAALLGCFIGAAAQDVTILHLKDGTTKRYTNGAKWATSMDFYEYTPTKSALVNHSTTHENGYVCDWGVNQVLKMDGEYLIGLFWQDEVPYNFHSVSGVCFGTEPGLTVDNCQQKVYSSDAMVKLINSGNTNSGSLWSLLNEHAHYMWIGPRKSNKAQMACEDKIYYGMQYELVTVDTLLNYITTPLEKGKTYYYRIFSEGKVLEGGQEKTVVFYDDERSFRVPRVMDDFGYFASPRASDEALAAFGTAHFPEGSAAPTWQQLEPLWSKWRATDEGKNYDLSADITSEQFDDGTGYRLNRIPDGFYTWIANREVVIDPFDVAEIDQINGADGNPMFTALADSVTNVDPKWGVPGGKYVRFVPTVSTLNSKVIYRSDEVMAGIRYKLLLNFAPETDENADSTYFLPTKIRVYSIVGSSGTRIVLPNEVKNSVEIPATQTTTIEVENFSTKVMGLGLRFQTSASSSEVITNGLYNRIMRIAEIRLIPMKGE